MLPLSVAPAAREVMLKKQYPPPPPPPPLPLLLLQAPPFPPPPFRAIVAEIVPAGAVSDHAPAAVNVWVMVLMA
jgi:hypothetical protein